MSNGAINWCRLIEGISAAESSVLMNICDRFNEEKQCAWPSIRTISKETKFTERTVNRSLKSLEQKGLILRRKSIRARDGGYASNTYLLPCYRRLTGSKKSGPVFVETSWTHDGKANREFIELEEVHPDLSLLEKGDPSTIGHIVGGIASSCRVPD